MLRAMENSGPAAERARLQPRRADATGLTVFALDIRVRDTSHSTGGGGAAALVTTTGSCGPCAAVRSRSTRGVAGTCAASSATATDASEPTTAAVGRSAGGGASGSSALSRMAGASATTAISTATARRADAARGKGSAAIRGCSGCSASPAVRANAAETTRAARGDAGARLTRTSSGARGGGRILTPTRPHRDARQEDQAETSPGRDCNHNLERFPHEVSFSAKRHVATGQRERPSRFWGLSTFRASARRLGPARSRSEKCSESEFVAPDVERERIPCVARPRPPGEPCLPAATFAGRPPFLSAELEATTIASIGTHRRRSGRSGAGLLRLDSAASALAAPRAPALAAPRTLAALSGHRHPTAQFTTVRLTSRIGIDRPMGAIVRRAHVGSFSP